MILQERAFAESSDTRDIVSDRTLSIQSIYGGGEGALFSLTRYGYSTTLPFTSEIWADIFCWI